MFSLNKNEEDTMVAERKNVFSKVLWAILFISTTTLSGCGSKNDQNMRSSSLDATSEGSASSEAGADDGADVSLDLTGSQTEAQVNEGVKLILLSNSKNPSEMSNPPLMVPGVDGKVSQQDMLRLSVWICSTKLDALVHLAKTISKRQLADLQTLAPERAAQIEFLRPIVKPIKMKYLKRIVPLVCPLVALSLPKTSQAVVIYGVDSATVPPNTKVN